MTTTAIACLASESITQPGHTAKEQHRDALRELNRGPDDVVPDVHQAIQRDMLR